MKINEFLKKLESEIDNTQKQLVDVGRVSRLKNILKNYNREDKIISSMEIADRIKTRPEEYKIMTGWTNLDNILKGFRIGQLITVSGITKHGKTSICVDLTTRIRQENPLWFPFEEGAEELIQKFLDRNEQPPLFYTPNTIKGINLEWIEERIMESYVKYGTKIVFIDHLDFIVPFNADNHSLRISQAMRELKAIARRCEVVIVLVCHLTKTRLDSEPTLEDIRGSSSIAQESDTVILVWRETKRENGKVVITSNVNVSVQANRRTGKTGNIKMIFKDGRFFEEEWKIEAPENDPLDDYIK
jgi:replicative DNA helicase